MPIGKDLKDGNSEAGKRTRYTLLGCDAGLVFWHLDHCSLSKEMTWRCPAEIFASCDHGALFARVVGGVVTAPTGFSILLARRGIVPRLLDAGVERWPFSLGCWLNTGWLGKF